MKTRKKMNSAALRSLKQVWLLGLVVAAFSSIPAQAQTTYYVRDAADICSAMTVAQPGDTLVMLNDGNWTDQDITFEGHGTPDQPIALRAESPGQVILRGRSRLRIGGEHLVVDGLHFKEGGLAEFGFNAVVEFRTEREAGNPCRRNSWLAHHSRLTNSVIEDYNPKGRNSRYFWVLLYGTYNRVDHSTFKAKNNIRAVLNDGFKDVGADELSTASITRRPLTPEDVGAPWFRQP